jgi:hypothetical protein
LFDGYAKENGLSPASSPSSPDFTILRFGAIISVTIHGGNEAT